jgi:hypothetical protein
MADDPSRPEGAGKQALNFALFVLKLAAYLAGLAAFGFLVFSLRRAIH